VLSKITHIVRVARSILRERKKAKERSPHWAAVRRKFLLNYPVCAACGYKKRLQVHHKEPFHVHPELELDPANLIALCMGPRECHQTIGHGDDWDAWNPNVERDAKMVREIPQSRRQVEADAKMARKYVAHAAR